ncbi:hypothetical protein [Psychrobacillus sp. NPDC096623]|uniref:hypothetical protein n=1 Tax=Psychrobacillus sp. NPDC096623 TaxID=3364492 RepID=UPI00382173D9
MGRNRYLGSWTESNFNEIDWSFSKENLIDLLKSVVNKTNQYTHQQICNWCDKHYMNYIDKDGLNDERLYGILEDISAQWELYLANNFSFKELHQLNFSKVNLPIELFEGWLKELT